MAKFRKKPVVIEAVQYDGDNWRDVLDFSREAVYQPGTCPRLYIQTLEGDMDASVGDWIIRGVKNEFYPCKPDIFTATYDPVA